MDKDGIAQLMNTVKDNLPQGMKLTPTGWTAEGDRVAAEVESFGKKAKRQDLPKFVPFPV